MEDPSTLRLLAVAAVYFLPVWVAPARRVRSSGRVAGVVIVTTPTGWTTAGWVAALVRAATHPVPERRGDRSTGRAVRLRAAPSRRPRPDT